MLWIYLIILQREHPNFDFVANALARQARPRAAPLSQLHGFDLLASRATPLFNCQRGMIRPIDFNRVEEHNVQALLRCQLDQRFCEILGLAHTRTRTRSSLEESSHTMTFR